jgi:hypothetical protein
LREAIQLEPLSEDQIQAYFNASGEGLVGLQRAIEEDPPLREMAQIPLMLYMMSDVFGKQMRITLSGDPGNLEKWRETLFCEYVKNRLKIKDKKPKPFKDMETLRWLTWLASGLKKHNLGIYCLDQMQPSWLPSTLWIRIYMIASRLGIGIFAGFMGSILVGMGLREKIGLQQAIGRGLVEGLLGGLVAGLVVGLADMVWIMKNSHRDNRAYKITRRQVVLRFIADFLMVFAGVSLAFAILDLVTGSSSWIYAGLQLGILFGLCSALLLAFGSRAKDIRLTNDIQAIEQLGWTSHSAWRGALIGALAGAFGGMVTGVFFGCHNPLLYPLCRRGFTSLDIMFGILLITGIFSALIGFIFGGLGGTILTTKKPVPNEGIWISLKNSTRIGGLVGLLFVGAAATVAWLVSGSIEDTLTYGLYGLFVGVLAALYYGGIFAIQHLTLSILLWRSGSLPNPWRLVKFLDYSAQIILLSRVGGAYKFIHPYLQEYLIVGKPSESLELPEKSPGK